MTAASTNTTTSKEESSMAKGKPAGRVIAAHLDSPVTKKFRPAIPEAADAPDDTDSYNDWDSESPLDGWVLDRLVIETRHGERPKLLVQTEDGEELHAPFLRAGLRALIELHDPQIGDAVSVRHHGVDERGRHLYSMRVARAE